MTSVYGVTHLGARDQVHSRFRERGLGDRDDEELFAMAIYAAKVCPQRRAAPPAACCRACADTSPKTSWLCVQVHAGHSTCHAHSKLHPVCCPQQQTACVQTTLDSLYKVFNSASAIKTWLSDCANLIARGAKQPKRGAAARKAHGSDAEDTSDAEDLSDREDTPAELPQFSLIPPGDVPGEHVQWTTPMGLPATQPYSKQVRLAWLASPSSAEASLLIRLHQSQACSVLQLCLGSVCTAACLCEALLTQSGSRAEVR